MNRRRLLLGAAGVGLVLLSVAGTSLVAGLFPSGTALSVLGNDYALVAVFGVAALLAAAVVVARGGSVDQTRMPDPESATAVPAPGDPLAETLSDWRFAVPFAGRDLQSRVRERLRDGAVEAVRGTLNCDDAGARERVARGTWTDDPHAAALLADDRSPSVRARLTATFHGDSWFVYAARRTAGAVADLDSGDASPVDPGAAATDQRSAPSPAAGPHAQTGTRAPGAAPDAVADGGADRTADPRDGTPQRERAGRQDGASPRDVPNRHDGPNRRDGRSER